MITIQRCNVVNYALNNKSGKCNNIKQQLQPMTKASIKNTAKNSSDSIFSIILKTLSNIF